MKSRCLTAIVMVFLWFGMADVSYAALETIGYGYHYDGEKVVESALIWDKDIDANGNSLVWLDYSNGRAYWSTQVNWAGGLAGSMFVKLSSGYSVTWEDSQWRLPSAGEDSAYGYNQTSSEMGHLFYEELGLDSGVTSADELNASEFDNLIASWYWSGTEDAGNPGYAWGFSLGSGGQVNRDESNFRYGIAVRSGQVSAVPVPGAIWLLGSGLAGLTVLKRKKKNRV